MLPPQQTITYKEPLLLSEWCQQSATRLLFIDCMFLVMNTHDMTELRNYFLSLEIEETVVDYVIHNCLDSDSSSDLSDDDYDTDPYMSVEYLTPEDMGWSEYDHPLCRGHIYDIEEDDLPF